ncbi:MAG: hypothetical protein WB799_21795 [Candidatus Sulfotelmatobacter sp.]|jgi:hypothetical protein
MGPDIRLPIGLLFVILGLLLAGFGAVSEKGIYERSLGCNVNLAWGMVLLVFGIVMVALGNRANAIRRLTQGASDAPIQTAKGSHDR